MTKTNNCEEWMNEHRAQCIEFISLFVYLKNWQFHNFTWFKLQNELNDKIRYIFKMSMIFDTKKSLKVD